MDPKMDSGVIPPRESTDPTFDPAKALRPAQVIWIMDQLSCLEIAWLDGYPLSQTIFTSLHMDRLLAPDNKYPYTLTYGEPVDVERLKTGEGLTHVVLRAYCVALAKCCGVVLQLIQSQNFYEEEDFVTHLFGRELLPRYDETRVSTTLDEAAAWVAGSGLPDEMKVALSDRLMARRSYTLSVFGEINEWENLIDIARDKLALTHALSEPLPEAFTDKVQRHLATSTPPRPMLEVSYDESQKTWVKLYSDIAEAGCLTSIWTRQSPGSLQRATWAYASRNASTYPRAVFQDLLFAEGRVAGDVSHFDLLLTDLRDLVLAGDSLTDPDSFQIEMPSDPRHICSRILESFMDKVIDEYLNIYRMVCQNRCRIRRTFTQSISLLDELETRVAADADREINAHVSRKRLDTPLGKKVQLNPLTSWSRYYKLKTMAETVALGFETDIYLDYEMGQMYSYLAKLAARRNEVIEHIELFLVDRTSQRTKSLDRHYAAECLTSREWLHVLRTETNCTAALASALSTLHNLLLHLRLIKPAARPFAKPQLVYEARMKPYLAVADPRPPSLEGFQQSQRIATTSQQALTSVENEIKQAKTQLTSLKLKSPQDAKHIGTEDRWKAEIKQLETTCVAVSVGVSLLKRTLAKYGGDVGIVGKMAVAYPAPEKRYHPWWVVPQLREVS